MKRTTSPALNRVFEEELSLLSMTEQAEFLGLLYRMIDLKEMGAFDIAVDRIKDMHLQLEEAHRKSMKDSLVESLINGGNYRPPISTSS